MALQRFDEFNNLSTRWFEKMTISEAGKKKRVQLSLDYCEIILMLFYMITEEEYEADECIAFLEERLVILAENALGRENMAYINDWAKTKAEEIVNQTLTKYENEIEDSAEPKPEKQEALKEKNKEEKQEDQEPEPETDEEPDEEKKISIPDFNVEIPEQEYWTSDERGLLIGIELSMTVYNFGDLCDAIDAGMNHKIWVACEDDNVRMSHQVVNGADIPINDLFNVGHSYLLMPGDTKNGAEVKEIAGCRCHLYCYKR